MKSPITVAQLIERLNGFSPDDVVMLECEDHYYSGPMDIDDLTAGAAVLIGPHEYQTSKEDSLGRPIKPKTRQSPGGWAIEPDGPFIGPIIEKKRALVIKVES